MIIKIGVRLRC